MDISEMMVELYFRPTSEKALEEIRKYNEEKHGRFTVWAYNITKKYPVN